MKKNFICWTDDIKLDNYHFLNSENKIDQSKLHQLSISINCAYAIFDSRLLAWVPKSENIYYDSFDFLQSNPIKFDNFGARKVSKIFCNNQICHIITEEGNIFSWGNDKDKTGVLGLGEIYLQITPVLNESFRGKRIIDLSISEKHGAAIDCGHQMYTWGTGLYGELGLGMITRTTKPMLSNKKNILPMTIKCGCNYTIMIDYEMITYYYGIIQGDSNLLKRSNDIEKIGFDIEPNDDNTIAYDMKVIPFDTPYRIENIFCGEKMIALVDMNGGMYLYNDKEGLNRVKIDTPIKSVKFIDENIYAITKSSDYIYEFSSKGNNKKPLDEYIENLYSIDESFSQLNIIDTPYYDKVLFFSLECTNKSRQNILAKKEKIFHLVKNRCFSTNQNTNTSREGLVRCNTNQNIHSGNVYTSYLTTNGNGNNYNITCNDLSSRMNNYCNTNGNNNIAMCTYGDNRSVGSLSPSPSNFSQRNTLVSNANNFSSYQYNNTIDGGIPSSSLSIARSTTNINSRIGRISSLLGQIFEKKIDNLNNSKQKYSQRGKKLIELERIYYDGEYMLTKAKEDYHGINIRLGLGLGNNDTASNRYRQRSASYTNKDNEILSTSNSKRRGRKASIDPHIRDTNYQLKRVNEEEGYVDTVQTAESDNNNNDKNDGGNVLLVDNEEEEQTTNTINAHRFKDHNVKKKKSFDKYEKNDNQLKTNTNTKIYEILSKPIKNISKELIKDYHNNNKRSIHIKKDADDRNIKTIKNGQCKENSKGSQDYDSLPHYKIQSKSKSELKKEEEDIIKITLDGNEFKKLKQKKIMQEREKDNNNIQTGNHLTKELLLCNKSVKISISHPKEKSRDEKEEDNHKNKTYQSIKMNKAKKQNKTYENDQPVRKLSISNTIYPTSLRRITNLYQEHLKQHNKITNPPSIKTQEIIIDTATRNANCYYQRKLIIGNQTSESPNNNVSKTPINKHSHQNYDTMTYKILDMIKEEDDPIIIKHPKNLHQDPNHANSIDNKTVNQSNTSSKNKGGKRDGIPTVNLFQSCSMSKITSGSSSNNFKESNDEDQIFPHHHLQTLIYKKPIQLNNKIPKPTIVLKPDNTPSRDSDNIEKHDNSLHKSISNYVKEIVYSDSILPSSEKKDSEKKANNTNEDVELKEALFPIEDVNNINNINESTKRQSLNEISSINKRNCSDITNSIIDSNKLSNINLQIERIDLQNLFLLNDSTKGVIGIEADKSSLDNNELVDIKCKEDLVTQLKSNIFNNLQTINKISVTEVNLIEQENYKGDNKANVNKIKSRTDILQKIKETIEPTMTIDDDGNSLNNKNNGSQNEISEHDIVVKDQSPIKERHESSGSKRQSSKRKHNIIEQVTAEHQHHKRNNSTKSKDAFTTIRNSNITIEKTIEDHDHKRNKIDIRKSHPLLNHNTINVASNTKPKHKINLSINTNDIKSKGHSKLNIKRSSSMASIHPSTTKHKPNPITISDISKRQEIIKTSYDSIFKNYHLDKENNNTLNKMHSLNNTNTKSCRNDMTPTGISILTNIIEKEQENDINTCSPNTKNPIKLLSVQAANGTFISDHRTLYKSSSCQRLKKSPLTSSTKSITSSSSKTKIIDKIKQKKILVLGDKQLQLQQPKQTKDSFRQGLSTVNNLCQNQINHCSSTVNLTSGGHLNQTFEVNESKGALKHSEISRMSKSIKHKRQQSYNVTSPSMINKHDKQLQQMKSALHNKIPQLQLNNRKTLSSMINKPIPIRSMEQLREKYIGYLENIYGNDKNRIIHQLISPIGQGDNDENIRDFLSNEFQQDDNDYLNPIETVMSYRDFHEDMRNYIIKNLENFKLDKVKEKIDNINDNDNQVLPVLTKGNELITLEYDDKGNDNSYYEPLELEKSARSSFVCSVEKSKRLSTDSERGVSPFFTKETVSDFIEYLLRDQKS